MTTNRTTVEITVERLADMKPSQLARVAEQLVDANSYAAAILRDKLSKDDE